MGHTHTLPTTLEQVKPCIGDLLAVVTGKGELDWLQASTHATEILQFAQYTLGADANPLVLYSASESAEVSLTHEQEDVLRTCLAAIGEPGPAVGGPLSAWAIKLIIEQLIKQLLRFIDEMVTNQGNLVTGWGDGSILKILLENLPAIIEMIKAIKDLVG